MTEGLTQAVEPAVKELLDRYLELVAAWGARANLVGSTSRAALRVHLDDALAASDAVPQRSRVVDLGSGAGFPGIPLLIARPDLEMTLVEIRERRYHFLRHVARTLSLRCQVLRERIESPPERAHFQIALVRALAPLPRALLLCAPWVEPSGEVWIWTRERSSLPPEAEAGSIPLGARGRILRIHAAAVPRGTS